MRPSLSHNNDDSLLFGIIFISIGVELTTTASPEIDPMMETEKVELPDGEKIEFGVFFYNVLLVRIF